MTSRRTSFPRSGKQSDPKNKGKRKEKGPTKAEAEYESDLVLEEAIHKEKEDDERRAELRHKRGEDSLRAAHKHQKATGPLGLRPCLEKVNVRGVEVDCSAKTINRAYFDDDDADATDNLKNMENLGNHYTWIASLIVVVMNICQDAGVPEIEKIDEYIWENQIGSQVEHSQVAEAQPSTSDTLSETQLTKSISVARMVQVANMTAQNNTRLTLLIEHIPDMIKRAIDKALAPVPCPNSRLPDLSIFGVPLPEDVVFKDERVETDEEELEDDHVTKELDEE
ncbi:hypothetical protein HAX54_023280, partial [Datura stramonium]|nr:hypothetical protein [Datura stramonium]